MKFHSDLSSFYRREVVPALLSIPVTATTSKMAALTKRIYSSVFLISLALVNKGQIFQILYEILQEVIF